MIGTLLKSVISQFSTEFDLDDVMRSFGNLEAGPSGPQYREAIEYIKLNIQWRVLNEKPLQMWLKQWNVKNEFE
jgi:hypothetical protein